MIGDFQFVVRRRPRFGNEPESNPESSPVQLLKQATCASFHYAELSGSGMGWMWGRASQSVRGHAQIFGILQSCPIGGGPQGGYGQDQPVPRYPVWVCSSGTLPIPGHAFEGSESQLNPKSETVPTYPNILWGQISHDYPGFPLSCIPHHHQSAPATAFGIREGGAIPYPRVAWPRDQLHSTITTTPRRLEDGISLHAHKRVPAEGANPGPKTGTPQASIGHYQHRHAFRYFSTNQLQKLEDMRYPGPRTITGKHNPRDRNPPQADDKGRSPPRPSPDPHESSHQWPGPTVGYAKATAPSAPGEQST